MTADAISAVMFIPSSFSHIIYLCVELVKTIFHLAVIQVTIQTRK